MKIEIELSEDFLRNTAEAAVKQNIGINKEYGRTLYSSDFAANLRLMMAAEIKEQLAKVDFSAVIADAVGKLAKPTIAEVVEAELKAMAKKAAKGAVYMKHARPDYDRIQDPAGLIPEDEPVFLLRAQDIAAPSAVEHWAYRSQRNGASQAIVDAAIGQALAMREWQQNHFQKTPDMSQTS